MFGPSRSGVYNELPGYGPSFVADIGSFSAVASTSDGKNLAGENCPCEILALRYRNFAKAFPSDPSFICGTRKYGPLGNRENQAAYVTDTFFDPVTSSTRNPLLAGSKITANFFSLFDTLPHRPMGNMAERLLDSPPSLTVIPSDAVLALGTVWQLFSSPTPGFSVASVPNSSTGFLVIVGLNSGSGNTLKLTTTPAFMYNKVLYTPGSSAAFGLPQAHLSMSTLSIRSDLVCP
mgnify:CR=1 FL=1